MSYHHLLCTSRLFRRGTVLVFAVLANFGTALGQNDDPELEKFQGTWDAVELVVDGEVVSADQIRDRLPSGGRLQVIENAILFRSPADQKKRAKTFFVRATEYPKTIDVQDAQGNVSRGIYQFDQGRIIICATDDVFADRPKEFSAAAGSQRMLLVLKKSSGQARTPAPQKTTPAQEPEPATALTGLSDDDVKKMLVGTWMLNDNAGSLFFSFRQNSAFNTVREQKQLALFHRSVVRTPVSSGSWSVKDGQLTVFVDQSIEIAKVNHAFTFSVRSVSERDLIVVDWLGRTVRALKVK